MQTNIIAGARKGSRSPQTVVVVQLGLRAKPVEQEILRSAWRTAPLRMTPPVEKRTHHYHPSSICGSRCSMRSLRHPAQGRLFAPLSSLRARPVEHEIPSPCGSGQALRSAWRTAALRMTPQGEKQTHHYHPSSICGSRWSMRSLRHAAQGRLFARSRAYAQGRWSMRSLRHAAQGRLFAPPEKRLRSG